MPKALCSLSGLLCLSGLCCRNGKRRGDMASRFQGDQAVISETAVSAAVYYYSNLCAECAGRVTRREKKHGEVCHCIGPGNDKLQMYPV